MTSPPPPPPPPPSPSPSVADSEAALAALAADAAQTAQVAHPVDARAHWQTVEAWLDRALQQPPSQRSAWLQGQLPDAALRSEIAELLQAEEDSRELLSTAPYADAGTPSAARTDSQQSTVAGPALAEGDLVGVWRVQALIGRGGSGEVYRVQRDDGTFEQLAALKLLRTPDDPEELQRFDAERRLLARLQHPAIARLIDGGAHGGRLFAVLELVQGVPLDQYAQDLPLAQKVALFEQVVVAVAYAHGQWVVHRDLKPANVLVDSRGQVQLLDFGIAKIVEGPAADADTAHTTLALRLTPAYCAPEQLRAGPLGATADVYALGVVLYQLLSGQLPWQLHGSGVQRAVQRLGLLDPPAPPSSHLKAPLSRQVRGDLDAIVGRCLAIEPQRRYANAQALLQDLQRWRQGLPVLARGDAATYVLGRMVRRHRTAVAAACAVLLSLLLGLAGVAWQAREAGLERDMARAEATSNKAVRDYLLTMFRVAGEQSAAGQDVTARQLLADSAQRLSRDLDADPATAAPTLLALAQLYFQLNDYVGAAPLFERLLERAADLPADTVAQVRLDLAQCLLRSGRSQRVEGLLAQSQAFWRTDPARWRSKLLESRLLQAQSARAGGQAEEAVRILQDALPERIALSGELHVETATHFNNLGLTKFHAGQLGPARQDFEQAWRLWQQLGSEASNDGLNTLNNWAALELREGQLEQAERLFSQALELRRAHLPPSAALAALLNNLGKIKLRRGAAGQALPLLGEAVALGEKFAGANSQHTLSAMLGLGEAQIALAQFGPARQSLDEAQRRIRQHLPKAHPLSGMGHLAQARWHAAQQDWPQARVSADDAESAWQQGGVPMAPFLAQVEALRATWPSP